MRSRWRNRLFWLALLGVLVVPSSAAPEAVQHGLIRRDGTPLAARGSSSHIYIAVIAADDRLPRTCPGSDGHWDFDLCTRLEPAMLLRAKADPADVEAARAEATTVKWLLTNTDSKAALQPATGEEVWQRLHRAGYRQLVVRPARRDDPAPEGSIVHAIPFGTACLIGFQRTWEGVDADIVMGSLPGGGCLPP